MPPQDDPQSPDDGNDQGWFLWKAGPNPLVPDEVADIPECQHLDHCGAVRAQEGARADSSWLAFMLPSNMQKGAIIVCCYRKHCARNGFFNDHGARFIFDSDEVDLSKADIYPTTKCLRLQKTWSGPVKSEFGHLYLSVKFDVVPTDGGGISHVIAY